MGKLDAFALNDGTAAVMTTVRTGTMHKLRFTAILTFHCSRGTQPIVIGCAALARASLGIFASWVSHNATLSVLLSKC
jgi:hypothetical protein